MSISDAARDLAQELLNAGRASATETFTVTNTNDEIVVTVVRREKGMVKKSFRNDSYSLLPSGRRCPSCQGTGVLD